MHSHTAARIMAAVSAHAVSARMSATVSATAVSATATAATMTTTAATAAATSSVCSHAGRLTKRHQSDSNETSQRETEKLDSHNGPHFSLTIRQREARANAEGGKANARRGRAASGLCPSPRLSAAKPFSRFNYSTVHGQMMRFYRTSPVQSLQMCDRKLLILRASCLRRRLVAAIDRPCRGDFGAIMAVV
jgi:hypothetical protein